MVVCYSMDKRPHDRHVAIFGSKKSSGFSIIYLFFFSNFNLMTKYLMNGNRYLAVVRRLSVRQCPVSVYLPKIA